MKIEKIEKIGCDGWIVETKEKVIGFLGISAERFVEELEKITTQPEVANKLKAKK